MNIYLTGAHGTGKTTVADLISDRTFYGTLPSVSRTSPYPQGTIENQRYVMDKVFRRFRTHDNVILDRTPIDVYAYTEMMGFRDEYKYQKMQVDMFFRIAQHTGNPIFYFPIAFELVNDGVRPGKWEQHDIDTRIKSFLDKSGVEYYTMPDATPEERVSFVLERIDADAVV